eukprot:jgi/Mesvir1/28233/Mv04780-RA.1
MDMRTYELAVYDSRYRRVGVACNEVGNVESLVPKAKHGPPCFWSWRQLSMKRWGKLSCLMYISCCAFAVGFSCTLLGSTPFVPESWPRAFHAALHRNPMLDSLGSAPKTPDRRGKCFASPAQKTGDADVGTGRVAVVTMSDGGFSIPGRNFRDVLGRVWDNNVAYTTKHGYDLVNASRLMDATRPPSWSKIRAVKEVVRTGRYDWVLWMDADALFTNHEVALGDVLHEVRYERQQQGLSTDPMPDLVVTTDTNGVNAGMLLFRATPWSLAFLDLWWSQDHFVQPFGRKKSGDNAALRHLLAVPLVLAIGGGDGPVLTDGGGDGSKDDGWRDGSSNMLGADNVGEYSWEEDGSTSGGDGFYTRGRDRSGDDKRGGAPPLIAAHLRGGGGGYDARDGGGYDAVEFTMVRQQRRRDDIDHSGNEEGNPGKVVHAGVLRSDGGAGGSPTQETSHATSHAGLGRSTFGHNSYSQGTSHLKRPRSVGPEEASEDSGIHRTAVEKGPAVGAKDELSTFPMVDQHGPPPKALLHTAGRQSYPRLMVGQDAMATDSVMASGPRAIWHRPAPVHVANRGRVHVAARQCLFNGYPLGRSLQSLKGLLVAPVALWRGAWSQGDFIAHLAGVDDKMAAIARMEGQVLGRHAT